MSPRTLKTSANPKRVELKLSFDRLVVQPACLHELRSFLTYHGQDSSLNSAGALTLERCPIELFGVKGDRLSTSPGLKSRVQRRLEEAGYKVTITDLRRMHRRTAPDDLLTTKVGPEQRRLLACAGVAIRGQLLVHRGDVEAALLLHDYFPGTRTLIVTATHAQAKALHGRLERQLLERVELPSGDRHPTARLCVVDATRFARAVNFSVDLKWGLVLFLGVDAALSVGSLRNQEHPTYARRYVLHNRSRLSWHQHLLLEHVAGPLIYRQSAYGEPVPEVHIESVVSPATFMRPASNPLERKRQMFWCNERRNRLIADIAKAYDAADLRRLQRLQLHLSDTPAEWATRGNEVDTVIAVETVVHAQELGKLLPGWSIHTNKPREIPSGGRRIASWETYAQRQAIVTLEWIRQHGLAADVVIRADGTSTRWEERWGAHPDIARSSNSMLLVDVQDDVDTKTRRDARERLISYQEYGWMTGPDLSRSEEARARTGNTH